MAVAVTEEEAFREIVLEGLRREGEAAVAIGVMSAAAFALHQLSAYQLL